MQKENKNSKRVQPKPKQEKKQWQQRHHLHSEKCYRQQKKSGKKANVRNKILWTENNFFSNRKRPKGRQKNKTATSRPTLTLPNTLPTGQRKFRFQFFKKKVTNQDFLKKNSEKFYWSRKTAQLCWCPFIGPLDNTWTNQGLPNRLHDDHSVREL